MGGILWCLKFFKKGACICIMNLNVWTYVFFYHVHHTMHFYSPVSECESYLLEISLNPEWLKYRKKSWNRLELFKLLDHVYIPVKSAPPVRRVLGVDHVRSTGNILYRNPCELTSISITQYFPTRLLLMCNLPAARWRVFGVFTAQRTHK